MDKKTPPPLLADRDPEPEPEGSPPAVRGGTGTNVRRWWIAGVAALVVALGAFSAVSALSMRSELDRAQRHIQIARELLEDGEIDLAISDLEVARELLGRSRRTINRPDFRVAGVLPIIGTDVRIARAVVVGADDVVDAGTDALVEARALLAGDLAGEGLPVDQIAALAPLLRETAIRADAALALVRATPQVGTTQQVTDARAEFLELLGPVADQVQTVSELATALPPFLGSDGPRTYLLAAANPAEIRGVGGYLGSYSFLTIEDGSLDFGEFAALEDLDELPADAVPTDLLAPRYRAFGGTWRFKNANMTPDMPSAARVLVAQFEVETGRQLDGVLVVDPFALAAMLKVTGPVTISDGTTLDADNAVPYLVNEAYADFEDADERKSELGEAATLILGEFLGDAGAAVDHLADLGKIVARRHLLLYSVHPEEQEAFAAANMDGALPDPEGDFLAVIGNSATNAKVDFWLEQSLDYRVTLLGDGAATGELDATLTNDAPTEGWPRYVLGPSVDGIEVGGNRLYLSTYCATTCDMRSAVSDRGRPLLLERELGHPVAGGWLEIPAGESQRVRYTWRTEGAWHVEAGTLVYRLTIRPQTMVNRVDVNVEVVIPADFEPAEDPGDGVEVARDEDGNQVLRWSGSTARDLTLDFRLRSIFPDGEDSPENGDAE